MLIACNLTLCKVITIIIFTIIIIINSYQIIIHFQSSLLMAILGELPFAEGTISVKGKIAYTSQQAWIYNGSLRQNILFGKEYNKRRFSEVVKACALEKA